MVRLERGGADFLTAATEQLLPLGGGAVFSPALYPDSTKVWRRVGYETYARLAVMERSLTYPPAETTRPVAVDEDPDWEAISSVDRAAFEGFWRMSRLGLQEAHATNRKRALLVCRDGSNDPAGFAIVGTQWGITYLHRIAVHPDKGGRGFGAALTDRAIAWGRSTGGRAIVLNVREENQRARRLYGRSGFSDTGTSLEVLRYPSSQLLD